MFQKLRATAAFYLFFFLCFGNELSGVQTEVTASTRMPNSFREKGNLLAPKWRYLLHFPSSYQSDPAKRWPVIVYLHGQSLRGNDLNKVKRYGPPAFLDRQPDFPFVVISPQLPDSQIWPGKSIVKLVEEMSRKYRVDTHRVYLTGVSTGGAGCWDAAAASQFRFAAMAPLCGSVDTSIANKVNRIPIWAFHGEADKVKPVGAHNRLVTAVNQAGGNARLTVLPGGTHGNIIFPTYQRRDLYDWFLSHSRRPPVAEPVEIRRAESPQPVIPSLGQARRTDAGRDRTLITWEKLGKLIPQKKQHVVRKGETLWGISRNYGVTVDTIKMTNKLKGDRIDIGQVIVIPSDANSN